MRAENGGRDRGRTTGGEGHARREYGDADLTTANETGVGNVNPDVQPVFEALPSAGGGNEPDVPGTTTGRWTA